MVQMPGCWSRGHYGKGEVRLPGSLSFTPDPWDRCLSLKISESGEEDYILLIFYNPAVIPVHQPDLQCTTLNINKCVEHVCGTQKDKHDLFGIEDGSGIDFSALGTELWHLMSIWAWLGTGS